MSRLKDADNSASQGGSQSHAAFIDELDLHLDHVGDQQQGNNSSAIDSTVFYLKLVVTRGSRSNPERHLSVQVDRAGSDRLELRGPSVVIGQPPARWRVLAGNAGAGAPRCGEDWRHLSSFTLFRTSSSPFAPRSGVKTPAHDPPIPNLQCATRATSAPRQQIPSSSCPSTPNSLGHEAIECH